MKYRKYKCTDCNSCKYKKDCTTSSSGRTIQRWVHEDVLETVYNETLNNNEVYKQRRCIVEHPFGTIKGASDIISFFDADKRMLTQKLHLCLSLITLSDY
ncbi:MAG: transposase [Blautia faecis]